MTATLLKAEKDGWTVYHLTETSMWAATVQLPERINGFDTISRYDFETRTEACDWCFDMVAMRAALDAWRQAA